MAEAEEAVAAPAAEDPDKEPWDPNPQSQADKNAHAEAVAVLNGRPSEVDRQKALEKLANLSDCVSANQTHIWEDPVACEHIVTASAYGQPNKVRFHALRCLANFAGLSSNGVPMWRHTGCRMAIIAAADDSVSYIKDQGLMALCSLTIAGGIEQDIWNDPRIRTIIMKNAKSTDRQTDREKGIWALANLTYCKHLHGAFKADATIMAVLTAGAKKGQPKNIKENASGAVERLEKSFDNLPLPWEAEGAEYKKGKGWEAPGGAPATDEPEAAQG